MLALMVVLNLAGWWWIYSNNSNKKESPAEIPTAGKPILHIDNQPNSAAAPCDCGEGKSTQRHASAGKGKNTTLQNAKTAAVAKPVIGTSAPAPSSEAEKDTSTPRAPPVPVLDEIDENYGVPQVEFVPLDEVSTTTEIVVVEVDSGGYDHHDYHDHHRYERPVYDVPAYVPGSVLAQQPKYVQPVSGGPNGGGGAQGPVNPAP